MTLCGVAGLAGDNKLRIMFCSKAVVHWDAVPLFTCFVLDASPSIATMMAVPIWCGIDLNSFF